MKRIFAIAAMAATVAFASCNKDNESGNGPEGQKAKLTIGVSGTDTRAAGTLTDNSDNVIGQFMAFAFQGDALKAILTSADGATVSETVNITTAIDAVYVIANANANAVLATVVPGTTNKADFLALTGNLLNASDALDILTGGKVWASSAVTTLTPSSYSGAGNEASVNISVVPVAARINVTVDDQRTNVGSPGAWVLTETQMLNVAGTTPFIAPAAFVVPTAWYSAYANTSNPSAVAKPYFDDDYSATGHLFYAFENNASAFPTIVTLVVSNDGGATKRYFPVHFTTEDAGNTVVRGSSYQVAITLKGDALDDPGIITPEEPIVSAKLTVTVSVTNWNMVSVPKVFE